MELLELRQLVRSSTGRAHATRFRGVRALSSASPQPPPSNHHAMGLASHRRVAASPCMTDCIATPRVAMCRATMLTVSRSVARGAAATSFVRATLNCTGRSHAPCSTHVWQRRRHTVQTASLSGRMLTIASLATQPHHPWSRTLTHVFAWARRTRARSLGVSADPRLL
jgi:hypothetical protein